MVLAPSAVALEPATLSKEVGKILIVAHRESTAQLEETFTQAGWPCEVLRQRHTPEMQRYSPSYLCLLNHCRAWKQAAQSSGLTLIVEADFVPVRGLETLPLPFDPTQPDVGIAWLYTCAPQVYSVSAAGYAQGFSTSMVAYLLTPASAQALLEFAQDMQRAIDPTVYSSWDSKIDQFLRSRQFKNYVPFRNYGDHGGRPNPEHRLHGLASCHRADVLYGKLAFLPTYAIGSFPALRFLQARVWARLKGVGRLLSGRYLRLYVVRNSSVPLRLLRFAIGRHLGC